MSRRDTISKPYWRVQLFRPDGTVAIEGLFESSSLAHEVFEDWRDRLEPLDRVELQHREAGASRFKVLARWTNDGEVS